MRLLVVDEEIIAGGVDTLRRQLMPELARLVEEIVWVLPAHVAAGFRELDRGNVTIETLNTPRGTGRIKEAVGRRLGGSIPRRLLNERVRGLGRRYRCDLYMTTCAFGQEFPEVDLPVVAWVSDVNPALPERIRDNILHWVERAAQTYAISDFTCSELKRIKPGCAGKVYSIPLASPRGVTMRDGIAGSFYYPAAPNKHKGHLTLLEAARRLAARGIDFRLTLTGAGMDALKAPGGGNEVIGKLRHFLSEHWELLEGRVIVGGDTDAREVERLFAEASCVVLPSSYEGFGLPLAEALGYGKRVICADIAPFREQIERHGFGCLATFVPVGDAGALEEAMAAHLAMGKAAGLTAVELKERLDRWTWADAAHRCHLLLKEVVGHG